jgi:tRNA-splicing ligase RtcB (3'-phosphate/5'-hydroxy nucleic acid ligase)
MAQATDNDANLVPGNVKPVLSGTHRWEIAAQPPMRVPARIFTDEDGIAGLMQDLEQKEWSALRQLVNVATLPGIVTAALAMADVHPGYGFPIGGVAAFDPTMGVVSLAGVGFDINCGMRTLRTPLTRSDLEGKEQSLLEALYDDIPAGLGSTGALALTPEELDTVLTGGAREMVARGFGFPDDLEYIEEGGVLADANPDAVSLTAKRRQHREVGTLGAGNHYVEVQVVDRIYDDTAAAAYGIRQDQILVTFHTGSRALGHQIGNDYLPYLEAATAKYGLQPPDRELVAAPILSPEGRHYLAAVRAGSNCAFANRQVLAHLIRQTLNRCLHLSPEQVETLYEVCHNTVKRERHVIDGEEREVLVHRKGATRAFGPGREEVPSRYRAVGQPVLVGGTMGTMSFILRGTDRSMVETFGSALHGAGRAMSRNQAAKQYRSDQITRDLREKGVLVRAHGRRSLAEEAPGAYKDAERVVEIMADAGIVGQVARVRPLICIKG